MASTTESSAPNAPGVTLATRLSLVGVVLFGLSYMSPSIVMQTFGIISGTSGGAAPSAYLIAMGAMLLTALSYGKLARVFPTSGSAYTYAGRLLGRHVGFVVGWSILLDYFFLPVVAWLVQSLYLNAQFPEVPIWAWLLINAGLTTLVNILGITMIDRVNRVLLVLAIAVVAAFVAVCVVYLGGSDAPPLAVTDAFWNSTATFGTIVAAASIAAYSFLGFDAVSTLSEETHNPKRNIPRGIIMTVLIGGTFFTLVAFVMQLVHPGGIFENESTVGYTMSVQVGGTAFADVLNILQILGGFAGCVVIQASATRLMYVMGRDGVLPRRFFGYLHPKFRTPILNILLVGAASFLAIGLSLETAASLINFGAFLAFAMVNICVVSYFVRCRRNGTSVSILGFLIFPLGGAAVDIYLLLNLGPNALTLGVGWLVIGLIYLAVLTRGFRRKPPELDLQTTTPDVVKGK
ncbi:APC family permease [Arthrobacter sp. NPDC056886]|uniref:APC family permease n=1 Tax=Arthrobacter sp. NPDC056886 TaxID=3345960 RepID=UPI00366CDC1C